MENQHELEKQLCEDILQCAKDAFEEDMCATLPASYENCTLLDVVRKNAAYLNIIGQYVEFREERDGQLLLKPRGLFVGRAGGSVISRASWGPRVIRSGRKSHAVLDSSSVDLSNVEHSLEASDPQPALSAGRKVKDALGGRKKRDQFLGPAEDSIRMSQTASSPEYMPSRKNKLRRKCRGSCAPMSVSRRLRSLFKPEPVYFSG